MKGVVEIAYDASAPDSGGLPFQVQYLSQQACLPKQSSGPPRPGGTDAFGKFGNHTEAESAISCNLLMAAYSLRRPAEVSLHKCEQWQVLRAALRMFPEEFGTEGGPQAFMDRGTSL